MKSFNAISFRIKELNVTFLKVIFINSKCQYLRLKCLNNYIISRSHSHIKGALKPLLSQLCEKVHALASIISDNPIYKSIGIKSDNDGIDLLQFKPKIRYYINLYHNIYILPILSNGYARLLT